MSTFFHAKYPHVSVQFLVCKTLYALVGSMFTFLKSLDKRVQYV